MLRLLFQVLDLYQTHIHNLFIQGAFDTSIVDEAAASGCVLSIITHLASPIFNDSKLHQIASNCTKLQKGAYQLLQIRHPQYSITQNHSKPHQIAPNCNKSLKITSNCTHRIATWCKRVHINYYIFGISK